ncbi:GLPGLI family protein [Pinibacter soli]|uniref:GLPGLI family protein n=1 Tax=Pinibacter soli TaxID=3044211 RepID=A0ABT6RIK8_9BACT|nr:GLPGLI family protein [Pinibacter soli]MDI3322406.1 GLPGLI family protein [Pinibacter soli]
MKMLFTLIVIVSSISQSFAQQIFVTQGKIEFEKRVNLYKMLDATVDNDEDSRSWVDGYKKSLPDHKNFYFDLYFNGDKTLYKPGREEVSIGHMPDWLLLANENTVFTDLAKNQSVSQKSIYEGNYLIQDSLRKVNWKITSDTRNIAGFECRKAVGIIMDSVYVIAFYTDEIITHGGPESFTNLPGMILGVAIPRLNVTWFATKLELVEVPPTQLVAPKKGKKVDNKALQTILKEHLGEPGSKGNIFIWNAFL